MNTLNIEEGTDRFATSEGAAEWLVRAGLAEPGLRATKWQRDAAVEVREALRTILQANNDEDVDPLPALGVLDRAAEAARFSIIFDATGHVGFEPRAPGTPGAVGRLLAIVARAMEDGSFSRLKACASDTCRWAFYDSARNRSGKWCDMAVCGNRMKARTYRARQAE